MLTTDLITNLNEKLETLEKLERQHRERLAGVGLAPAAGRLLNALDRETSIRWENIPDRAECDWNEAARAVALLAGANLCEASPTRIRLSEYGDKLLADLAEQASHEVESPTGTLNTAQSAFLRG